MARTPSGKKKKARKKGATRGDNATFIRAQPTDTPAADVQEKGKKAGLNITKGHIYTIRHSMRHEPSKAKAEGRRRRTTKKKTSRSELTPASATQRGPSDGVARLQVAIMDVGLQKAREVFDELQTNVMRFLQTNGAVSGRTAAGPTAN